MDKVLSKNAFFKSQNLEYAFDGLTKVLNREMIGSYLNYLVDNNIPFCVCLCDIDNFKNVNDTYGHMIGDEVLRRVVCRIVESVGDERIVGRYGGDEFIIVAEGVTDYESIWNMCHKLNKDLSSLMFDDIDRLTVTLTTGVSRYPIDGSTYNELIDKADKALYRGKTKGRNCFIIYLAEKHANIEHGRDKETLYSSTEMHARIFKVLSKANTIRDNVKYLLQFLSNSLMIDHVCIEDENNIVMSIIHPLSKGKNFDYIDINLINSVANTIGITSVSRMKANACEKCNELYSLMCQQDSRSMLTCTIESNNVVYGVLRFDMGGKERLWQTLEIDLLVTAAKLLGNILFNLKLNLEVLKKGN